MMVVTRVPLRISFAGGGTDIPKNYPKGGAVVSAAIDKYIYVIAKNRLDSDIHVAYKETETVNSVYELKNDLIRVAMLRAGMTRGVEVHLIGDLSSFGAGLGSSGAVLSGLLAALLTLSHKGMLQINYDGVARTAWELEAETLNRNSGWQDPYGCVLPGLKEIWYEDDEVHFRQMWMNKGGLESSLVLIDTDIRRDASNILAEQAKDAANKQVVMQKVMDLEKEFVDTMDEYWGEDEYMLPNIVGGILNQGWHLKKQFADGVSFPELDAMYDAGIEHGATGGKLLGAGGGGFFLFVCPPEDRRLFVERMEKDGYRHMPVRFDNQGIMTTVID